MIVDIWGTWCPPCREEIPHFIKLKDAYADDLAIVGINYEDGEGDEVVERIRQFATERGMNYPCVIGDQATQDQVPNLQGFPTTLFLDREGKVRLKVVGYHPYEKLEAYINVLLSEGPAHGRRRSGITRRRHVGLTCRGHIRRSFNRAKVPRRGLRLGWPHQTVRARRFIGSSPRPGSASPTMSPRPFARLLCSSPWPSWPRRSIVLQNDFS